MLNLNYVDKGGPNLDWEFSDSKTGKPCIYEFDIQSCPAGAKAGCEVSVFSVAGSSFLNKQDAAEMLEHIEASTDQGSVGADGALGSRSQKE